MADPRIRTLKIKTGIVKRLTKEKQTYEKEAVIEQQRTEKFKGEGKDEHVIRKQEEVVQECLMMVPDCQRRLSKAFEELKNLLDTEKDLQESEDYQNAVNVLNLAQEHIPKAGELLHVC